MIRVLRSPARPHTLAAAAALLCVLGTASACGDDSGDGGAGGSGGSSSDPVSIEVTFDGDSVTPNGDRVDVALGQEVDLEVTADAPGEIHVHSDPEQEFEYEAGTQTITLDPVERPGIIEVESHSLDKVIVQLQVQ